MLNIVIIGAGQIGSRHLQSLAQLKEPARIHVFDPSPASLQIAKDRYAQIARSADSQVDSVFSTTDNYPQVADVAIIATSAKPRLTVLRHLLDKTQVKYLLLEKVLFQRLDEYDAASDLFDRLNVNDIWVNCPSRLYPFYQELSQRQIDGDGVTLSVYGSQWGLGCNAIHALDAAEWVFGSKVAKISVNRLDRSLVPSKRPGYSEFTGTLTAVLDNRVNVQLTSYREGSMPYTVMVNGPEFQAMWDVANSIMHERHKTSNWQWLQAPCKPLFQSALTASFVEEVSRTGTCSLPPFKDSADLHRKLLTCLLAHMQDIGELTENGCPIT